MNSPDADGNTPLHKAADNGALPSCILLVEHGARIDVKNHLNFTPYQLATIRCVSCRVVCGCVVRVSCVSCRVRLCVCRAVADGWGRCSESIDCAEYLLQRYDEILRAEQEKLELDGDRSHHYHDHGHDHGHDQKSEVEKSESDKAARASLRSFPGGGGGGGEAGAAAAADDDEEQEGIERKLDDERRVTDERRKARQRRKMRKRQQQKEQRQVRGDSFNRPSACGGRTYHVEALGADGGRARVALVAQEDHRG